MSILIKHGSSLDIILLQISTILCPPKKHNQHFRL